MINIDGYVEEVWIRLATELKCKFILILKDLEDKDIYPIYFTSEKEMNKYENNILSEMKVKVVKTIRIP